MAVKKGMSGLDLRAVIAELNGLMPLWIGKIYQYDQNAFGFRLNGEDRQKFSIIAESGVRVHLTKKLPKSPENPSGYSMYLRKYLSGGRILEINQPGIQRVLDLTIGKSESIYHLIFEFFDEGNAILCDSEYTILNALKRHRFKDRDIIAGEKYAVTGKDITEYDEESAGIVLAESDKDIVRTLASSFMLGGRYAEEICRISGIAREAPASEADPAVIIAAFKTLSGDLESKKSPAITKSGCWPLIFEGEIPEETFETYSQALDSYFGLPEVSEAEVKKKLSKAEIIRKRQQEAIVKFEEKITLASEKVEIIYANYQTIADIVKTLSDASLKMSWQEIEDILKNADNPMAKMIKRVYPSEAAVDILLDGKTIKLYASEGVEGNAGRYYSEIKKFKKKKAGALVAMERFKVTERPERKRTDIKFIKPKWYHKFRWFYTSDDVLVIGGRDAGTNEDIVRKYLEGKDTFLHADIHGGSAVAVKGETECMDEAAVFAVSYSNAWKSGFYSADVYAVPRDQVSKTAESGESLKRGAFVIRGERKYYRNVAPGISVGLQTSPEYGIIGGPSSAIEKRKGYFVRIVPGTYEPNDIARKILKALKEMIPENEQKNLKKVLNTENIAAFVPPGGSDIAE
ncbi:ribosome rescue protein RqcH [Methanoplanus limicola]|uniref:Fibronectin-binding A domain protein n=1 Tax=Methanoplanus limicola DSM 2279 TaxID=937775 RepID=H1Z4B6_9EURY|nr:ribosome rescue protein RqcH [Methanoplanus limicola]EHQ36664.1 Fibronectin-binding A domain protein [Methanoplanus limicola DSM 2279]